MYSREGRIFLPCFHLLMTEYCFMAGINLVECVAPIEHEHAPKDSELK